MELSALKFAADTTELERASKVIAGLVTDVAKLDKASRDAAKTEEILAKAAKLNAEAHLQNAKAQDVRLKSTITADKADKANEQSLVKKTKAIEKETEATAKNVGVLQKQKDILEFQTQGYSKGQAGILAYGRAAGLAASDIAELGKVLETQRKLMGVDPFDKSSSGLKSLQNQYTELKESVRQYNTDSDLTSKQTRELARDKERLIEKMKVEGASFQDIRKAVRAHNDEYVNLAGQYNKLSDAEAAVVKGRRELISATNYVSSADQKMAAALNQSNAALDKGATDSLSKYEAALRKSGMAQDVVTQKLATYKNQLTQVQGAEEKRKAANLARALQPQFTDIGVSLYSGQSPLTVLLQQSGQMVDLFKLSGIEAQNLGKVMKEAFASMLPAIGQVAKGLGSLVVESFLGAGRSITTFAANITGITTAVDSAKRMIASGGEENFKYIASLQKIGNVASAVTAAGLAAVLLVLVAMAIEYKNIIQSESELSKALATSGGALGFSKDQAVAYAEGMKSVGVGTLKAMDAITEFAKVGKIGKDGLDLIIKSALDLEKYAGVAIGETAKKFSELQDEPTKALTKFAEANGYVSTSVLDTVASLEQQGDKTAAATAATEAMRAANVSMADEAKSNLSPIAKLWDDIKSAVSSVKQEIYDLTTSNAVIGAMRTVWETVAVVVSQVWFTLKGVGKEIGGIAAQIGAVLRGDFAGAKSIGEQMKFDAASAREEQDKLVKSLLTRGETEKKNFSDSKEQNSQYAAWRKDNEKALEKQYSKSERLAQKEKQLQADVTNGVINQTKATEALAGWKRIIMGEDKKPKVDRQGIKDLETEIDLRNKSLGLLGSFNNELDAIERRRAKSGDEDQYQKSLNALIEKQPIYLERQKEINAAHDLTNKLFGKADMLGKDYYKTLEQINKEEASGLRSPENAERARQAAFDQTQLAKENLKYIEDSTQASQKYAAEVQKNLGDNQLQNKLLDDRVALLGLTSEQARLVTREQDRKNKLLKVDLDYQDKILKLKNDDKLNPFNREKAILDAMRVRTEEEKLINREVAVQAAEDFDAEFRKIKEGVTDSIVTALFEGGKAGSKKLRDVLVNVLRQKVTMVVDVGVNAFMNSLIGGALGKGGVVQAGSSALSTVGSVGSGYSALAGIGGAFGGGVAGGFGGLMGSLGLSATGSTLGGALSAGGIALQSGNILGGLGTLVGALGPIVAGISVLASIFGKDDSGTYHTGGAGSYSAAGGASTGAKVLDQGLTFGVRYKDYNSQAESAAVGISQSIVGMLDATAKSFGNQAGYFAATAFADDSSKDGAWGSLIIKRLDDTVTNWADTQTSKWAPKVFSDGEAGQKEYSAALALSVRDALVGAVEGVDWAQGLLKGLGSAPTLEGLQGVVETINAAKAAFVGFGQYMPAFTELTNSAVSKMADASGGVGALAGNMGAFVDGFYTDAEKLAINTKNVTDALANLGFEMPKTREDFKALVQSQIDLGAAGANTAAGLLAVSGAVSAVLPPFEDAAAGVETAIGTVSDAMKRLQSDTAMLEIELLRAQGNTTGANAAQRSLDTQGFTEAEIAVYDYNQALKLQISTLEDATKAAKEQDTIRVGLEKQLLQLQGDTVALRLLDIAGMDEYNISLYDQVQTLTAAAAAAKTLAENASNLRSGLISLEGRFTGGGFSKQYKAEDAAKEVNSLLSSVGINKDVATITSALLNSTTDEVQGYFREIWEVLDTDEARLRLVQVSNAMLDIATTSETAAEKFQKQSDSFSKLASEVASLFEARNTAGNLLDKIAGAMGNQGSFAGQRESELWSALGSTNDYKKKVELASQLTDIVLQRQQLEVQNAERLLSFGQGLRDYVNGLKLSDLSPLTNAEKLAEASKQYSETLTKAIGGDANAQSGLQAISSSYLELARTYYAGNEQFSDIFNSVTSALDTLGINSMTESQQQIAIGNQSLGELQKLYGITETTYEALNTQYENSLSQLTAAQEALTLQASSLEQLISISSLLTNLPAEISVRLPIVNTDLTSPALVSSSSGAASNAELVEELRLLRLQVAQLEASNREDAAMQANVYVGASQATAETIVSATNKAARAAELKQGATLK